MTFFARMNPLRALRDLRLFFHQREPYELGFLVLAVVLTGLLIIGFAKDSSIEKVYKPDIIYVEQYKLTRTDAEIVAQQKIDQAKRDKEQAALRARQEKTQAEFKRLDDKLEKWGL